MAFYPLYLFYNYKSQVLGIHKHDYLLEENWIFWKAPRHEKTWVHIFGSGRDNDIIKNSNIIKENLNYTDIVNNLVFKVKDEINKYYTEKMKKTNFDNMFIVQNDNMFILIGMEIVYHIYDCKSIGHNSIIVDYILTSKEYQHLTLIDRIKIAYKRYFDFIDSYGENIYIIDTSTDKIERIDIRE